MNLCLLQIGRLENFDLLANKFVNHHSNRDEIINEATLLIETLPLQKHATADYYLKIMRKIHSEGEDFIVKEIHRIEKVLLNLLLEEKRDELQKKRNILEQFRDRLHDEL